MPSLPTSTSNFALASLLVWSAAAGAEAPSSELLERLQADHQALRAAERDYHRNRGRLGAREAADYQDYLARLRERLREDCRDLSGALGGPLPAGLPCPTRPAASPLALPIDPAEESTESEKVSTLDAQLAAGLGEFDEMLLQEQQRVKAARTASAQRAGGSGQGEGSPGGSGAGGAGGETGEASDTGDASESTESGTGDRQETSASTTAKGGAGGPPRPTAQGRPDDTPDGSDDDVVARQLREAAEKEQDPELKKRLWEEYRRYKRGNR